MMTWTQLDAVAGVTGTPPSARHGHSMTAAGADIYLFGGEDQGRGTIGGWDGGGALGGIISGVGSSWVGQVVLGAVVVTNVWLGAAM